MDHPRPSLAPKASAGLTRFPEIPCPWVTAFRDHPGHRGSLRGSPGAVSGGASLALPQVRKERGLTDDLVRISAGIEDPMDLIRDLDKAMQKAMATVGMEPADCTGNVTPGSQRCVAALGNHWGDAFSWTGGLC